MRACVRIDHQVERGFVLSDQRFLHGIECDEERRGVIVVSCHLDHGVSCVRWVVLDEQLGGEDPAPVQVDSAVDMGAVLEPVTYGTGTILRNR